MKKEKYLGKFIAVDGPNGVGKTTIISEVCKELGIRGYNVYQTKEPTDSKLGNMVRIMSEEYDGKVLACLVAADRYAHLKSEILPQLKSGAIVITDRYILSSLILQCMDGVQEEFIFKINDDVLQPDLQVVVLAEDNIIQERLNQREKLTRFEENNQTKKELNYTKKGADLLKLKDVEVVFVENNNIDKTQTIIKIVEKIISMLEENT